MEYQEKNGFYSGKRDRWEIISAIIAVTQHPSSITSMMKELNLNYSTIKEYLNFLISRRLIEKSDNVNGMKKKTEGYIAAEKGLDFLRLYCRGLILLHGEDLLQYESDHAEAFLLQYCRENKMTLNSDLHKSPSNIIKRAVKT